VYTLPRRDHKFGGVGTHASRGAMRRRRSRNPSSGDEKREWALPRLGRRPYCASRKKCGEGGRESTTGGTTEHDVSARASGNIRKTVRLEGEVKRCNKAGKR